MATLPKVLIKPADIKSGVLHFVSELRPSPRGCASSTSDGVPSGNASDENQDRLLQGRKRKGKYPSIKFDFLGYCFRPRLVHKSRDKTLFCGFNPAVSPSALKSMRAKIRELGVRHRTELSSAEIAYRLNPLLQGWINYYGR
jgi:Group II intron, maturase-specific domain